SRYAHDQSELATALADATTDGPAREHMVAAGRALFAGDPADDVVELASTTRAHALLTPFETPRGRRRIGVATATLLALYLALTIGAQGIAALGVGIAKPPKGVHDTIYLGVRVDGVELRDPELMQKLETAGVTVVIDGRTASASRFELQERADNGTEIANGGWGKGRFLRWNRAHDDCVKSWQVISATSGGKVDEFVPGRSIDAFDQIYCRTGKGKQRLVRANVKFRPESSPAINDRKIYLLNGRHRDPDAVA